jgi:hypothetical protein
MRPTGNSVQVLSHESPSVVNPLPSITFSTPRRPRHPRRFHPRPAPHSACRVHDLHDVIPRDIEPRHDNQVRENKDRSLKVIRLALSVRVGKEKHAQDHGHHIPLREYQTRIQNERVSNWGLNHYSLREE